MQVLRQLVPSDAVALAELVQRNRAFLDPWEPVRPEEYFTLDGQREAVEYGLSRQADGAGYSQVILDETGAVAGRINLNNIVRGPFQSASVGYWLSEDAGGRGLATRAVVEMVGIAFGRLGLHRVEAGTIPENHRSQAVLRRAGFERFGYAVAYLNIAGRWRDHLLFQRLSPSS
ncbi:MAG: GNAT family N-acetyltransferase [Propionibacteriaceae bacterium]|nr:GNAT family N-acetyltransferase [Propionibacteriaceae bacterium]